MLFRMRVVPDSRNADTKTFEARVDNLDWPVTDLFRVAQELDAGVPARFYRGGQPQGRVTAARAEAGAMCVTIRITAREPDIWRLVDTGAVNTVEIHAAPRGVEVFLKSVAAPYPAIV